MNSILKTKKIKLFYLASLILSLSSCSEIPFAEIPEGSRVNNILVTLPSDEKPISEPLYGKSIPQKIGALLSESEKSVDIAIYLLDHKTIIDSLLDLHNRGVKVRLIGDQSERYSDSFQDLVHAGISSRFRDKNGLMHHKFILIDKKILIAGTGNFTGNGFFRNNNLFLMSENRQLIDAFQYEFDAMFQGDFGVDKEGSLNDDKEFSESRQIKIFFSPQNRKLILDEMISAIDQAKSSIKFMIYSFSLDQISDALVRAANRGIKITGIIDKNFFRGVSQEAPRLFSLNHENVNIRIDGNENTLVKNGKESGGKLHTKIMLIDEETDNAISILGSFNWSANGLEKNDENLFIIHSKELTNQIFLFFKNILTISKDPTEFGLSKNGDSIGSNPHLYKDTVDQECHNYVIKEKDIILNEIHWRGNPENKEDQMFELANLSPCDIDISHWSIKYFDKSGAVYKWTVPDQENAYKEANKDDENYIIKSYRFLVLYMQKNEAFDEMLCLNSTEVNKKTSHLCLERLNKKITLENCYQNNSDYICVYRDKNINLPKELCETKSEASLCEINLDSFCSNQRYIKPSFAALQLCRVRIGDIRIPDSANMYLDEDIQSIRILDKNLQTMDEIDDFVSLYSFPTEELLIQNLVRSIERKDPRRNNFYPDYISSGPELGQISEHILGTDWDSSMPQNWCLSAGDGSGLKGGSNLARIYSNNGILMLDFADSILASPHEGNTCRE